MVIEKLSYADCLSESDDNLISRDDDFFYYFAYGSNLLRERISVQIKPAEFFSTGILRDYRLAFFGQSNLWKGSTASIVPKFKTDVWGCVWKVPNTFAEELDRQEKCYNRLDVSIFVPSRNQMVDCRTYQFSDPSFEGSPSPHYKHVILIGAVECNLPKYYIEFLDAIHSNGYKGAVNISLEAIKHLNTCGEKTDET